jgi:hypothetical protein
MLLIAAFISYVMWSVHDHPHINDNLTYWEWIGYSSFGVTVSCLALFIFFERKRILVLGGSYFDSKEGQFKVDSSRLSPPPLIGWLVWMYHLVQRRSLDR